jgi:hypothetical protein
MASINEAFPSNYLKAADLKGRNVLVTMSHADYEMIGDDKKLVLYFEGKDKGMVLNKTNASNIAAAYGDETDDWKGQPIVLFEAMVDFQGKTVAAIRLRMPQAKDKRAPKEETISSGPRRQASEMDPPPHTGRDLPDDEIPF